MFFVREFLGHAPGVQILWPHFGFSRKLFSKYLRAVSRNTTYLRVETHVFCKLFGTGWQKNQFFGHTPGVLPIYFSILFQLFFNSFSIYLERGGKTHVQRNSFAIIGPQEDEALAVIEARAYEVGATCKIYGQHWHIWEENGRLVFQDENGLLDLPLPKLIGAHQIQNAGIALATLRYLGR